MRARIWLVLIWIALRMVDAMYYFMVPDGSHKRRLIGAILNTILWSTVLLIAIGYRQNWARYLVVISLLFTFWFGFILLQVPMRDSSSVPLIIASQGIVDLIVALVLIFAPDIKKLTNRMYE